MGIKIIITFLLHIVGLVLLLVPNQYQGSVAASLLGLHLRTLDLAGIGLIIVGSVFINVYLFVSFRKQIRQMPSKDESEKIK